VCHVSARFACFAPLRFLLALASALLVALPSSADEPVRVGSKKFTESVILGEMAVALATSAGAKAEHRRELGGTQVLWNALVAGEIDVYAEYTGTIREEILGGRAPAGDDAVRAELASRGITASRSLGFNDGYALGLRRERAEALDLRAISDLARRPELRFGLSNEFLDRKDGWPGLAARYGLAGANVRGLDHDLAYRGLASGDVDVVDLYTTDAEIRFHDLTVLDDDRRYFPRYEALWLYREDLRARAPQVVAALLRVEGRVAEAAMIAMNASAKLDRVPEAQVAASFLARELGASPASAPAVETRAAQLLRTTREHLFLVGVSLLAAIALAIPLGVAAYRRPRAGQIILAIVGLLQTIPSIALLVVLIPLLGLGDAPAIVALVLYSLLPIVRGTHAGLVGIPGSIRESAEALGLTPWARLRLVELPMASRSILAGIKTAAVIDVGLATIGALIGAGGYGQPILTGIRLDRVDLILLGAVPSALLALVVQASFELAERRLLPRGLRL
jgi:osmoprotectant transport system permease protein